MSSVTGLAATEPPAEPACGAELQYRLRASGPIYEDAVRELYALMLRAAWHQASQMSGLSVRLGRRQVEEAVTAAADEATVAALSRLDRFQGRSRFTTWAYKFGILHAAVELRRAAWRRGEVDLAALSEPAALTPSPQQLVEGSELAAAVRVALDTELTAHQRGVVLALLVENVPIDVLADRLGSTRNAVYKTLHDARKKLRADLTRRGYLTASIERYEEVIP